MINLFSRVRRFLLGNPLPTAEAIHQRLSNIKALAIFSSDALSSVAYGTEEILWVLVASSAIGFSMPIHIALVMLLAILASSYRQTIAAYPSGGGSYIVAKDNLGVLPGLVAGASLITDYILTVAVSVSAGIAAITSWYPPLLPYRVGLALLAVLVIMIINLRGIKESGTIFAIPTYVFIISTLSIILLGLGKIFLFGAPMVATTAESTTTVTDAVMWLVVLRAFAAGCTSLTGVEAISNGVPAFRAPEAKNARKTMLAMALLLGSMILGMGFLSANFHVTPSHTETIMSQIAGQVYGKSNPLYAIHQTFTMLILILAANTSFAGFPQLTSLLARDRFLPRSLSTRGDRLVFSNGIIILAILSCLLIVLFKGVTHALLPLYAVGVFTSFTLSQLGMVVHWVKLRHKQSIIVNVLINGIGAITTLVVTGIIMFAKFTHGAWVVVLIIPAFVMLLRTIYNHYEHIKNDLKVGSHSRIIPESRTHIVVMLIGGTTSVTRTAVQYVLTLVSPETQIRAVHVNVHREGYDKTEERKQEFAAWVGDDIPLQVLESPYRSVIEPLDKYMENLRAEHPEDIISLVIPEFIPHSIIAREVLHGGTGRILYRHFHDKGFNVIVIPHRVS